MINVNADLFRAAYLCVSTEKFRYYLQGVYIEPCKAGGATLTSTDGHRLIAVYDASATCDAPAIVRLDKPALTALKRGKGETDARRVALADGESRAWVIDTNGAQLAFQDAATINGTFPDWRRVLPTLGDTPDETFGYNAAYLGSFGEASRILRDTRDGVIAIRHGEKGGPAWINLGVPHAFGVLMGVRLDRIGFDTPAIPSWVRS